jgi:hypothetical protein
MDRNTFQKKLEEQTLELTALLRQHTSILAEHDQTHWWQFTIKRELKRRRNRIMARVDQIVRERNNNYNEYLLEEQTDQRFAAIVKENWFE